MILNLWNLVKIYLRFYSRGVGLALALALVLIDTNSTNTTPKESKMEQKRWNKNDVQDAFA
jgi:hypothetical protein